MAFEFHGNTQLQFDQQRSTTAGHIIPFIESSGSLPPMGRVLEIGCGEGGALQAFLDAGYTGVGIELSTSRAEAARELLGSVANNQPFNIIQSDIHNINNIDELGGTFDLIVLKDVIEHVPDQYRLMAKLHYFLKPDGRVFISFPPWHMPYGGHQQVCQHDLVSKLPWIHLLPKSIYRWLLATAGEKTARIEELLDLKQTKMPLGKFERLARRAGYSQMARRLYLINPIYEHKFGLQPRVQIPLLAGLPYLRNFVTTCGYYLIAPSQ
ncbi:class I SAM-dependent methyltransferase [Candidatus Neomarinimicrobiota bacterium]